MKTDSPRLGPLLFLISVTGSLVLIAMGIWFSLDHAGAAKAYGVPLSGGSDNAYISTAALRDIAVGGLTLAFALLRDRRAVGLSLLFGAIIPIGDGLVVLHDSPAPLQFLPLHWGGAGVCLILAVILLRGSGQKS